MSTHTQEIPPGNNHDASVNNTAAQHDDKKVVIFVNTREVMVQQKTLTYQELVNLAYPGDVPSPEKVYEITYSNSHGPDGKLGVGGVVKVKEGMVLNVGLTNRS